MPELLIFMLCGLAGGMLGGYLGLGGGIIVVPGLTIIAGVPITVAVPASLAAVVVSSIAASNEYLKRSLVDFEIVVILAFFMVTGSVLGGTLNAALPSQSVRVLFAILLLYSAISILRGRQAEKRLNVSNSGKRHLLVGGIIALAAGMLSGLLGVGGGVVIVPLLYLAIGLPLSSARGTSSFTIGFSAAAGFAVYLLMDRVDLRMTSAVLMGSIIGAKAGGYFGTLAKPMAIKLSFFVVMLYLSIRLAWEPIRGLF